MLLFWGTVKIPPWSNNFILQAKINNFVPIEQALCLENASQARYRLVLEGNWTALDPLSDILLSSRRAGKPCFGSKRSAEIVRYILIALSPLRFTNFLSFMTFMPRQWNCLPLLHRELFLDSWIFGPRVNDILMSLGKRFFNQRDIRHKNLI